MPLALEQTSATLLPAGSGRRPELDALRGFFLVWMTLNHLPTHLSDYVNQPLGFVSSAEGFVFLSAMLVAHLYIRQRSDDAVRDRVWRRGLRIYGYHLLMLLFAFTVAAAIALRTHRLALLNLLDFYLAHPATAIIGSVLLIYCPPLLDILPMYVIFMLATPPILRLAARYRWPFVLAASGSIWLLAQFGLRSWMHALVVKVTHLQIPMQETGAFNLFAWQLIWILGLWIGSNIASNELPFRRLPRAAYPVLTALCLFFLAIRHHWLGSHLTQQNFGLLLDKWQIGPLRLVNLIAFACAVYGGRRILSRIVLIAPFLTLGRASLEVFCAHVFFVFVGLALLVVDQLHGYHAVLLVLVTFAGMFLVALRENHRRLHPKSPASQRVHVHGAP